MKTKSPPNAPKPGVIYRNVEMTFRAASADEGATGNGTLSGVLTCVGEIDTYGTIVHPGSKCFEKEAVASFIQNGAFLKNHRQNESPIGFIVSAKRNGRNFDVVFEYHSTDDAQEMRTIAMERMNAGKTVGLSQGFYVGRYEWFDNGAQLIEALKARKEDLKLYNIPQIEARTEWIGLMYVDMIVEGSQVNFQANGPSVAGEVRGFDRAAEGEEYSVLSVRVKAGEKITVDELLSAAREMGILDERTVEEIAAGIEDPEPPKTVDGTERFRMIDELLAKPRRRN